MQTLILPSEQLGRRLAGILAVLLSVQASLETGLLSPNGSSRNQRDRNLRKKKSSQKETPVVVFVCLIKACKAHVSAELQHLQQNRSTFAEHSPRPFKELNL